MKAKWMIALSVLSVVAILGAGIGYVVATDNTNDTTTTDTQPLLTDEQLADIRAMADELRANGTDMNQLRELIEAQIEQYITENLEAYGLTEDQILEIKEMFEAIDDKMDEIKEVAFELREQGATFEEIRDTIDPMMVELRDLQQQLVETLDGYGVSLNLPPPPGHHHPDHGMAMRPPPCMSGNASSP